MTRTRYHFFAEDPFPYFITSTTVNWLQLFTNPHICTILLDSLRFLIENQRIQLHAYVIMPNHIHLIASGRQLSKEVAKFKSYSARKIIDYYLENGNSQVLSQLANLKQKHKTDRQYQFWQEGSHPERITSHEMLEEKVAYLHMNPVKKGFVETPETWKYSSAGDYAGFPGLLPICMEFEGFEQADE